MVKNGYLTFDLGWPWMTLTLTWTKFEHQGVIWSIYVEKLSKMPIWPLTLGDLDLWPWPLVVQFIHTNLMAFVWCQCNQYSLKYGQKCRFDLDLGWPWMTLTSDLDLWWCSSFIQTYRLLFGVNTINIHWNMVKMSIWPWPWLTLTSDLDLWWWSTLVQS